MEKIQYMPDRLLVKQSDGVVIDLIPLLQVLAGFPVEASSRPSPSVQWLPEKWFCAREDGQVGDIVPSLLSALGVEVNVRSLPKTVKHLPDKLLTTFGGSSFDIAPLLRLYGSYGVVEKKSRQLVAADLEKGTGTTYPNALEVIFGGTATGEPNGGTTITDEDFFSEKNFTTDGLGVSEVKQFIYDFGPFTNRSAVCSWVYIEDPAAINSLNLEIWIDNAATEVWSRDALDGVAMQGGALISGWNFLRWKTTDSASAQFGTVGRVRFLFNTNAQTAVKLGPIVVEQMPKARILFVIDGARREGWDAGSLAPGQTVSGLDEMAARGLSLTLGLNSDDVREGDSSRFNPTELAALHAVGHAISFHRGTNGTAPEDICATMTEAQMRADVLKAQEFNDVNSWGMTRFRGGVLQNNGPFARNMVGQLGLLGTATGELATGSMGLFPFEDRGNVPRIALQGASDVEQDAWSASLQAFPELMVVYTHRIIEDGGPTAATDCELSIWNKFLSWTDAGRSGGWLEFVTYDSLTEELNAANLIDYDDHYLVNLQSEIEVLSRA